MPKYVAKGVWKAGINTHYPRAPLPLGTIHSRHGRGPKVKVKMDGPKQYRWISLARHLYEQFHGRFSIPRGKRAFFADGDSHNRTRENIVLLTPADAIFLWHDRNPGKSAENYRKLRAATARFNREYAAARRAMKSGTGRKRRRKPLQEAPHS